MNEITLNIDGKNIIAKEGTTVLDAARSAGIEIPTLCHHPALSPYGGCRLCTVEVTAGGRTRLVTSCNYLVADGLEVKTASDRVIEGRKMLLEKLAKVGDYERWQMLSEYTMKMLGYEKGYHGMFNQLT